MTPADRAPSKALAWLGGEEVETQHPSQGHDDASTAEWYGEDHDLVQPTEQWYAPAPDQQPTEHWYSAAPDHQPTEHWYSAAPGQQPIEHWYSPAPDHVPYPEKSLFSGSEPRELDEWQAPPTRLQKPFERQLQKTKMCTFHAKGKCAFGSKCTFAHDPIEVQAAPNLSKTKMCSKWKRSACWKENCMYAHGVSDLRNTPMLYKTSLCTAAQSGSCELGSFCRFAHTPEELR
eukprot:TRINITY_DN2110_c0_g1_i1.p1 TRINITY_DN2110_c0_g1~~TRINITY_DN2110_c0_g1_i1.p1  ORF type:complete len:260 (+),score=13.76 TRINITY_DN2110_c0_g1_i1:87-782(+)